MNEDQLKGWKAPIPIVDLPGGKVAPAIDLASWGREQPRTSSSAQEHSRAILDVDYDRVMRIEEKAQRVHEIEARMREFVRRPCEPRPEDEGKRQVRVVITKYGVGGRATKRVKLTGPNVGSYDFGEWRAMVGAWIQHVAGHTFSIEHHYDDGSVRDFVPSGASDNGPPRELVSS